MAKHASVLLLGLFFLFGTTNGYLQEWRTQCIYSKKDLSDMVYIDATYFNKIKYRWFNSTLGKYEGYTEHGVFNAERFNNDTEWIRRKLAAVEFCKHNAALYFLKIMDKTVEPKVKLRSVTLASGNHAAMLVCSAYRFYPKYISVSWLRDGKPLTTDVTATEEMANGDWYYQIHSHLMYTPKPGEKISCVVEHASFKEPMIYDWDPSYPERNKIVIGALGLVLGIVLSAAGYILYTRQSSKP